MHGNGRAKVWGSDIFGSIGDGDQPTDRITPVTVTWLNGVFAFGQGNSSRTGAAITLMKLRPRESTRRHSSSSRPPNPDP